MANKDQAERLLRAMGDVNDIYLEDLLDESSSRKAVLTPLQSQRRARIISIAAAAVIVCGMTALVMINMSKQNTTETARHNDAREEIAELGLDNMNIMDNHSVRSADTYTYGEATTAAGAEAGADSCTDYCIAPEEVTEDEECIDKVADVTEASDIDDLVSLAGFDFVVPESVSDSTDCAFFFYGDGIAEVQYYDNDGNLLCTIRKAEGYLNDISGTGMLSTDSETVTVGDHTVNVLTDDDGHMVVFWMYHGYTYSFVPEEAMAEDDLTAVLEGIS